MPVYHVETDNGDRLIQASTQNQALLFITKTEVKVTPLSTNKLANIIRKKGLEIEMASKSKKEIKEDAEEAQEAQEDFEDDEQFEVM